MQKQEIANALRDLEPEEAAQIARDYLTSQDYAVKMWGRDDVSSMLDDKAETRDLTPEQRSAVIDRVVDSYEFRHLTDATESDWATLDVAIFEAMREVS